MTPASRTRSSDRSFRSFFTRLGALALAMLVVGSGVGALPAHAQTPLPAPLPAQPRAEAAWTGRLLADLARVDAKSPARLGVYVHDLDTGASASYRADQRWYLASTVKVPVAIAVLRGVERGDYTLDSKVTLRASDFVDGAGLTNSHAVGTPLTIRFLLEQMIIHSDNTASDTLIDLVGIAEVNAVVESLVPKGFERITSLGDIRRLVYGNLVSEADRLTGGALISLQRQRTDAQRLELLSKLAGTPVARFRVPTLDTAYNMYYASGLNSGRLDAYGDLLTAVVEGKALTPKYTDFLLTLMERVATGTRRIKAGLPPEMRFAHKTGTQRRRTCDSGVVRFAENGHERRIVVVACTRDESSLERSEFALMQVGAALCRSGLLTKGKTDATFCHALPHAPERLPAAVDR